MLKVVIPITVKAKYFSCDLSFGNTVEIAAAAETPHTATAPPDNTPNTFDKPKIRANSTPKIIVKNILPITIKGGVIPSETISEKAIRTPSKPTHKRNNSREQKLTPS